ncbi:hypothetical protein BCY89_03805 [Sphingobacterium siyangense]|uniref:Uncharacterized protein n=1 Tax=Sphingobacterium siyangense TaxID=459529 RepID=A0A420GBQ2_9SPHI|nr:hypothetical protein [Sphingobacterium siyangense]RKF42605.1 hypothetical protein BCY89_03805 [Sphingobacterium siyangense]
MKFKFLFLSILTILLNSCGFDLSGEWDITELYVQKIEGSSKLLYKYDAWGGRDSHVYGFIIIDSTQSFKIDLDSTLPMYNLSEIPSKNKISGIKHECKNDCGDEYYKTKPNYLPLRIDKSKSEGIAIENIVFQYRGLSEKDRGLRGDFVFEKFIETKDSIYFFNLNDIKSVYKKHLDELKLKKGEVYLSENEAGKITRIVINQTTLNPLNNEIIQTVAYFLSPESKIESSDFSDRGIFREVKASK